MLRNVLTLREVTVTVAIPALRSQRNIVHGWHVMPVFRNTSDRNVVCTITPLNKQERPAPVNPVTLALVFRHMPDEGEVSNQTQPAQ